MLSLARHTFLAIGLCLLTLSSCGSDKPVERSFKSELELHMGRELTPTEVADYKDAAELLCGLEKKVLLDMWSQLEPDQFEFQTFVFDKQCPEKADFYSSSRQQLPQKPNTSETSGTSEETENTSGTSGTSEETENTSSDDE